MLRLRARVKPWDAGSYAPESIMDIREAIDRMEVYEAALMEIADQIDIGETGSARKRDIARRALEEVKT